MIPISCKVPPSHCCVSKMHEKLHFDTNLFFFFSDSFSDNGNKFKRHFYSMNFELECNKEKCNNERRRR